MNWKRKFFLVYPRKIVNEITWPSDWGNQCSGNLSEMIREQLNVKRGVGSEIKLIWNDDHRRQLIRDYNISSSDIDDYIKADCTLLTFRSERLMTRALKLLSKMGATSDPCQTTEYRDVIVQQAEYYRFGKFKLK